MPNWCENDLQITGPEKDVQAMLEQIGMTGETPKFDFEAVLPYPERFRQMDEEWGAAGTAERRAAFAEKYDGAQTDGYNSGGYQWCIDNWGTKWNVGNDVQTTNPNELTFSTAWSPPLPVIAALGSKHPGVTLMLRYYEGGMGYKGLYKVEKGAVALDVTSSYCGPRGG